MSFPFHSFQVHSIGKVVKSTSHWQTAAQTTAQKTLLLKYFAYLHTKIHTVQ